MSMPEFPKEGMDITQEQALNMVLTSIAMEELGLSHIINAEGEKLQYVLGTLPGQHGSCTTTEEIIAVNKSVTKLLEMVAQNQMLLKNKLDHILEVKEASCNVCPKEYIRLVHNKEKMRWKKNECLSWQKEAGSGEHIVWEKEQSCTICIPKCSICVLEFSFCFCSHCQVPIMIKIDIPEQFEVIPIRVFESNHERLAGNTVLHVTQNHPMPISFTLISPEWVCLERAQLSIVRMA